MKTALLILCVLAAPKGAEKKASTLDQAAAALTDFRAEDAVSLLERAKSEGPYSRSHYVRLYELLGIAYAYLDRAEDAGAAFDVLLALDPGRAISYTLSPKVTFIFEQARSRAADQPPPAIDLRWPLGLTVSESIPIDVEVVADPKNFLKRAKLHYRLRGSPRWEAKELDLAPVLAPMRVELPPGAPASTGPAVVEIYLLAADERGNEVYQWASETRPREVALQFEQPDPWYSKWWVWAITGTAVAAGASIAVFAATRTPGPTVGGTLEVVP